MKQVILLKFKVQAVLFWVLFTVATMRQTDCTLTGTAYTLGQTGSKQDHTISAAQQVQVFPTAVIISSILSFLIWMQTWKELLKSSLRLVS